MKKDVGTARLSESFIRRVEARPDNWPKRSEDFIPFFREVLNQSLRVETYWSAMKRGAAVPLPLADAMLVFADRKWGWKYDRLRDLTDIVPPLDAVEPYWTMPEDFAQLLMGQYRATDDLFIRNPSIEIPAAANLILKSVGRMVGGGAPGIDESNWQNMAERVRGTSHDEYSSWLEKMWEKVPQSLMLAMATTERTPFRRVVVGQVVTLPLNESAFRRIVEGELGDKSLTPEDLQNPSRYLYIHVLAHPAEVEGITVAQMNQAHATSLFYQLSYFTRGRDARRPVIATIGLIPAFRSRLQRFGYRENGHRMPGYTNAPIMVLHPKGEYPMRRSIRQAVSYMWTTRTMDVIRFMNRRRWVNSTQGGASLAK